MKEKVELNQNIQDVITYVYEEDLDDDKLLRFAEDDFLFCFFLKVAELKVSNIPKSEIEEYLLSSKKGIISKMETY